MSKKSDWFQEIFRNDLEIGKPGKAQWRVFLNPPSGQNSKRKNSVAVSDYRV